MLGKQTAYFNVVNAQRSRSQSSDSNFFASPRTSSSKKSSSRARMSSSRKYSSSKKLSSAPSPGSSGRNKWNAYQQNSARKKLDEIISRNNSSPAVKGTLSFLRQVGTVHLALGTHARMHTHNTKSKNPNLNTQTHKPTNTQTWQITQTQERLIKKVGDKNSDVRTLSNQIEGLFFCS